MKLLKKLLRIVGKAIELGLRIVVARTFGWQASMQVGMLFDFLRNTRRGPTPPTP